MMCCSPLVASPCHSPSPARHLTLLGVEAAQEGFACGICVCVCRLWGREKEDQIIHFYSSLGGVEIGRKLKPEGSSTEEDREKKQPKSHTHPGGITNIRAQAQGPLVGS